ncbi:MAG: hypothetical protein QOI58_511 [Thermoanaerobaculia bacterium]|jgi:hypothetical protein|nr:hypothetical protein [Thermoanaerobaculia bacterium]
MDLANFDPKIVDATLGSEGYLIVKDTKLEEQCDAARDEYDTCLTTLQLHAPRARFDYKQLSTEPWRKLAIGGRNGDGLAIAQNLQTTYFDANDENYPALGALFHTMIGVRNTLMAVNLDFGNDPQRDGFWNACRVHHYPRGGGFMSVHRDEYLPGKLAEKDKPFYQMLVLLSRKNVDFHTGGGVLVSFEGRTIDMETEAGFGSMILYDGRTPHGVEDVDLDQIIDFSRPDGRMAALVNLYCTT